MFANIVAAAMLLFCGSAYGQNTVDIDLSKERQVIMDGVDTIAKATAAGNTAIADSTAVGTADIAKAIREQTAAEAAARASAASAGAAAAASRAREAGAKKDAALAVHAAETLRQETERKRIEEEGKTARAPFDWDEERRKDMKESPNPDAFKTAVELYASKAAEGCQNLDVYLAMERGRAVGWTSCRDAIHGIMRPFKGEPVPPPPPPPAGSASYSGGGSNALNAVGVVAGAVAMGVGVGILAGAIDADVINNRSATYGWGIGLTVGGAAVAAVSVATW